MMVSNKDIDDDNVMTCIQITARTPSPSPPTPDARGTIVTTWIATTTTMHAVAAARIMVETTRVIKIAGGTTRGTCITRQRHATTKKWRAQQEMEPPTDRLRKAKGQHNEQPNKRGTME